MYSLIRTTHVKVTLPRQGKVFGQIPRQHVLPDRKPLVKLISRAYLSVPRHLDTREKQSANPCLQRRLCQCCWLLIYRNEVEALVLWHRILCEVIFAPLDETIILKLCNSCKFRGITGSDSTWKSIGTE